MFIIINITIISLFIPPVVKIPGVKNKKKLKSKCGTAKGPAGQLVEWASEQSHHSQHREKLDNAMKVMSDTHMTSDADSHDDVVQSQGTFLDLFDFIICKPLIEDSIDSILTDDHWQAQKHFLIYAVIALLHQTHSTVLVFLLHVQHQARQKLQT